MPSFFCLLLVCCGFPFMSFMRKAKLTPLELVVLPFCLFVFLSLFFTLPCACGTPVTSRISHQLLGKITFLHFLVPPEILVLFGTCSMRGHLFYVSLHEYRRNSELTSVLNLPFFFISTFPCPSYVYFLVLVVGIGTFTR